MKKYLALPLAVLAFAACDESSKGLLAPEGMETPAAPVGGPSFHHSSVIGDLKVVTDDKGGVSALWSASLINDKPSDQHVVELEGVETVDVKSATTYSKAGLTSGKTYKLRVTGHNGGDSKNSNVVWSTWAEFSAYVAPATPAKKTQLVTITAPSTATYGDHAFAISAVSKDAEGVATGLTVSLSVDGPCTYSSSTGKVTVSGVGNCVVTATQAGDATWNAAGAKHTIVVGQATPTITFSGLTNTDGSTFVYNGQPRAVGATVTGITGETATLTIKYDNKATEANEASTDAPSDAGSYTVTAYYAGSTNYTEKTQIATLNISKANPSISITNLGPFTYAPSTSHTATVSVTGVNGAALAHTVTYLDLKTNTVVPAASDAGSYTVTVEYAGSTNYNEKSETAKLVISQATATVTLDDLNHVFDGMQKSATVTSNPGGLNVEVVYAAGRINVGTYSVTATVNERNYSGSATGVLTISYRAGSLKFLSPVNNTPLGEVMSAFKYGSTIPVKFQLFNAAGQPIQTSNGALPTISIRKINSATGVSTVEEAVVSTTADSGNSFRWDATAQQYIFNLSTKSWDVGFRYEITANFDGKIVTEVTTKK